MRIKTGVPDLMGRLSMRRRRERVLTQEQEGAASAGLSNSCMTKSTRALRGSWIGSLSNRGVDVDNQATYVATDTPYPTLIHVLGRWCVKHRRKLLFCSPHAVVDVVVTNFHNNVVVRSNLLTSR